MEAPYSRIPALPAALGLAAGIAASAAGAAVWCMVGCAVSAVALWLWRPARFFAAAPAAALLGIALASAAPAVANGAPSAPAVRSAIVRTVYASPLSGEAAAFVATTFVADSGMLPQALRDDFRGSGIAHLLALSGFHVGIVAMIALWLTRPMLVAGRAARLRGAVVLAAVWGFAALGGMSASVVRASVMLTLLMCARLAGRASSPLNALAVAAIVILSWRPAELFGAGFQLSFMAVIGILAFANVLNPFRPDAHPRLHRIAAAMAVPVGATLATLPVVAATFGTVPLMFLPANVIAGILFVPFYVLALAMLLLAGAGLPCGLLAAAVDAIYAVMAAAARLMYAPVELSLYPAALVALYIAIALLWVYLYRKKAREQAY
ncbi:MAG: ComEC/Rec2 family competence protein [Muribaculaceae bacterium]